MASDDLVYNIIGGDFCSYKLKTKVDQAFCRNEYNVTGFCSRQACPLANSRYAAVRSDPKTGALYLYKKEVERAHLPSQWWEKIKLSANYTKALEQVDEHLKYWPKFLVHKNKQRLTRLTQVNIRIRKLAKEEERLGERLVPKLAPKVRRREETRERKAEAAAKVERAIERVLIDRLRSGAYGDRPLNVEPNVWKRVMKGLEKEGQAARDEDLDDGVLEEDEEVENEYEREFEAGVGDVEYVSDVEESEDDMEDFDDWLGGQSPDEEEDDEDEDDSGSESGTGEDDSEGDEGEEIEALKKSIANLKRKRPTGPPAKPKKKPSKDSKGPKREIEYEIEREPTARQLLNT